ncbi:cyanoexosortase A [Nostocales cyanobacterium LEGE 11386]|nr:cyanoexosortase A [Nostocales cyanobacterium LEGE 11386]
MRLTAKSASINKIEFFLLGIGTSLIIINLFLIWKSGIIINFYINSAFFILICLSLKEKRQKLKFESGLPATILGLLLLACVFISSQNQINFVVFSLFSPVMSGLGLAFLASGFKGLRQYRIELIAMIFLSTRTLIYALSNYLDISPVTAKLSTAILWYTGFTVKLSGTIITFATSAVKVYGACSGMATMLDMFSLGILFIFIFNLKWKQKILVPVVAIILGFIVNALRVALMAILVNQGDSQAFNYWHDGDGSLIFSMISALLLCGFCWFLLSMNQQEDQSILGS